MVPSSQNPSKVMITTPGLFPMSWWKKTEAQRLFSIQMYFDGYGQPNVVVHPLPKNSSGQRPDQTFWMHGGPSTGTRFEPTRLEVIMLMPLLRRFMTLG